MIGIIVTAIFVSAIFAISQFLIIDKLPCDRPSGEGADSNAA